MSRGPEAGSSSSTALFLVTGQQQQYHPKTEEGAVAQNTVNLFLTLKGCSTKTELRLCNLEGFLKSIWNLQNRWTDRSSRLVSTSCSCTFSANGEGQQVQLADDGEKPSIEVDLVSNPTIHKGPSSPL